MGFCSNPLLRSTPSHLYPGLILNLLGAGDGPWYCGILLTLPSILDRFFLIYCNMGSSACSTSLRWFSRSSSSTPRVNGFDISCKSDSIFSPAAFTCATPRFHVWNFSLISSGTSFFSFSAFSLASFSARRPRIFVSAFLPDTSSERASIFLRSLSFSIFNSSFRSLAFCSPAFFPSKVFLTYFPIPSPTLGGDKSESDPAPALPLLAGERSESESFLALLGGDASLSGSSFTRFLGGDASESESFLFLGGEASESCLLLGSGLLLLPSESWRLLGGLSSESESWRLLPRGGEAAESSFPLRGDIGSSFTSTFTFGFLSFFFCDFRNSDISSSSMGSSFKLACSSLITSLIRFFRAMSSPVNVLHFPDFLNSSSTRVCRSLLSSTAATTGSSSISAVSSPSPTVYTVGASESALGTSTSVSTILIRGTTMAGLKSLSRFFFFFFFFFPESS